MEMVSAVLVEEIEKKRSNSPINDWMVVSHPNSVLMKLDVASLILLYRSDHNPTSSALANFSFRLVWYSHKMRMIGRIGRQMLINALFHSGLKLKMYRFPSIARLRLASPNGITKDPIRDQYA